jgi:hypothetical protein
LVGSGGCRASAISPANTHASARRNAANAALRMHRAYTAAAPQKRGGADFPLTHDGNRAGRARRKPGHAGTRRSTSPDSVSPPIVT